MAENDLPEPKLPVENSSQLEDDGESQQSPQSQLAPHSPYVIENSWQTLNRFTPARIGLGRAGHSLPTRQHLQFQLDHAQARDAVYYPFDSELVCNQLRELELEVLAVSSAATDRATFLRRPDAGRRLSLPSRRLLEEYAARQTPTRNYHYDVVFVVGEGLSAQAIHHHAQVVLKLTLAELNQADWRIGPVVVASQSRVALGDEIGYWLGAAQVAILIGERPGLTSPDSLGIYLTYDPRPGRLESERNCISNIRPEGLSYKAASATLVHLMREIRRRKLSGVTLKDERDLPPYLSENS